MLQNSLKIWIAINGTAPSVVCSAKTYLMTEETVTGMDAVDGNRPERVAVIIPQAINGQNIALLLVPDELKGKLALNGQLLRDGVHILRHGDEICWNNLRLWVARDDSVKEAKYDPNIHGEDLFCARTRSRLTPGEPIIICPGTPSNFCGMIFKSSAWLNMKCHYCQFDPGQPTWIPTIKKRVDIDELLQIAEQ
jgi:hypothetical protein